MSLPQANYTQTPNALFDLMPHVSVSCYYVLQAVARQTFGWHKERDRLSISQFEKLTGLSRRAVINGVQEALELGLLERFAVGQMFEYQLVLKEDPCTSCTSSEPASASRAPVASAPRAPTKERLKETKSKESGGETQQKTEKAPKKTHHSSKDGKNETRKILEDRLHHMLEVYIGEEPRYRRHWLELPLEKVKGAVQRASERGGPKKFSTRLKEELDALTKLTAETSTKVPRGESAAESKERIERERARADEAAQTDAAPITNLAAMSDAEFERYNGRFRGALADANRRMRAQQQAVLVQDREARSQEQSSAARRYALAEQARQLGA